MIKKEKKYKVLSDQNFVIISVLLIISAVILSYSNSLNNSFQYDDFHHIHQSRHIRDLDSFKTIDLWFDFNNRTPAIFTLALNYHIGGLDVTGYHIFNLIIHISASLLVFLFAGLILNSDTVSAKYSKGNKRIIQLFCALIFAVHPVQTESVTYIVQRMESLSAVFFFGALIFYISFRKEKNNGAKYLKSAGFIIFSLLAVLTKQAAYCIPLVIILIELYFIRNKGRINKYIVFTISILLVFTAIPGLLFDLLPRDVLSDTTRYEYFLSQTVVIPRYIALLIFPVFQNIDHHIQVPQSLFSPEVLSGIAIIILLLSAAVYLYRKGHLLFSFSIIWFFSVIILRSSVLPISDLMTERRLYTAVFSLGLFIPTIWLFFIDRIRSRKNNRNISIIILGIITLLYASACFQRNRVWKNDLTLWTDSVSKSGRKYRPNYNAAKALKALGHTEKAQKYYLRALEINPNSYGACNNIGNIYAEQKKTEEAQKYFNRALEINPYYVRAMNNLANLYFQDKEYSKAQKYYLSAIKIDNNFAEAYQNLAILYMVTGNYEHALRNYRRVIKLDPNNSQAQKYIKILEDKLKTGD